MKKQVVTIWSVSHTAATFFTYLFCLLFSYLFNYYSAFSFILVNTMS